MKKEEWTSIKDTGLYDPNATDKDAEVTIMSSELNKLRQQLDSQMAAIESLREVLKDLIKSPRNHHECDPSCKCSLCIAEHVLSTTSGYERSKEEEGGGE